MNPKEQIPKLRKDLDLLLDRAFRTRQTFNAVCAVGNVFSESNALATYGDYFAYTQNIMIGDVQLQLAKLFDNNQQSLTIPKIINNAIKLFTEEYYKEVYKNSPKMFAELRKILTNQEEQLNEFKKTIATLKVLRDKMLAHFDKSINDHSKAEAIIQDEQVDFTEVKKLVDFAVECLKQIKGVMFNGFPLAVKERSFNVYTRELKQIAKAIEEYSQNDFKDILGGLD